jgi:hypothetical protein
LAVDPEQPTAVPAIVVGVAPGAPCSESALEQVAVAGQDAVGDLEGLEIYAVFKAVEKVKDNGDRAAAFFTGRWSG